ncbi:hypothetical protein BWD162_007800 [Bartonella sp. WD16.2]|nr:hypothetical protein BWD162_007800 [Bartonella sp. WD16.2]
MTIPIATIKKAMTGRGNVPKTEMIKAVRAKGHEPEDDNEVDALAILYLMHVAYSGLVGCGYAIQNPRGKSITTDYMPCFLTPGALFECH